MSSYKCGGSCCERLFYPRTPEGLKQDYEDKHKRDEDIVEIYHMLELLELDGIGGWYTCLNWDKESKLCKIYDERPQMCRDYPYDSPCVHCGWENKEYQSRPLVPPGGVFGRPVFGTRNGEDLE